MNDWVLSPCGQKNDRKTPAPPTRCRKCNNAGDRSRANLTFYSPVKSPPPQNKFTFREKKKELKYAAIKCLFPREFPRSKTRLLETRPVSLSAALSAQPPPKRKRSGGYLMSDGQRLISSSHQGSCSLVADSLGTFCNNRYLWLLCCCDFLSFLELGASSSSSVKSRSTALSALAGV